MLENPGEMLQERALVEELLAQLAGTHEFFVRLESIDARLGLGIKQFRRSAVRPIGELAEAVGDYEGEASGVLILAGA